MLGKDSRLKFFLQQSSIRFNIQAFVWTVKYLYNNQAFASTLKSSLERQVLDFSLLEDAPSNIQVLNSNFKFWFELYAWLTPSHDPTQGQACALVAYPACFADLAFQRGRPRQDEKIIYFSTEL